MYVCKMKVKGDSIKPRIADKHTAILNAALEQISMYGFHGTSIKMIANSAQVATGSIYNHFSNKEEVINALYQTIGTEINELVTHTHNPNQPFEQDFLTIWKVILNHYLSDSRKSEFITQYAYSPYIITQTEKAPDILLAPILDIYSQAKKNGIIKNLPNSALLALTHSPITSLVRMAKYGRLTITDLNIEQYAQACWDSIKIK